MAGRNAQAFGGDGAVRDHLARADPDRPRAAGRRSRGGGAPARATAERRSPRGAADPGGAIATRAAPDVPAGLGLLAAAGSRSRRGLVPASTRSTGRRRPAATVPPVRTCRCRTRRCRTRRCRTRRSRRRRATPSGPLQQDLPDADHLHGATAGRRLAEGRRDHQGRQENGPGSRRSPPARRAPAEVTLRLKLSAAVKRRSRRRRARRSR